MQSFPVPPRVCLLRFLVAFLSLAGAVFARPIRVAYTHWYPCVPLGIADDKQYWRDAGLQVQLRGYQTSQEVIEALSSGEVDIGYDLLASWVDVAMHGVAISIVGETDWSNGGDKLLVRKGLTLAEQKGKPIAVYLRGSGAMLFLRESLARLQLSLPEYPIVEVPEQERGLELFTGGKVDVVLSNEPWASRIEAAGAVTVATTADFPGVSPEGFAIRRGQVDDATLQRFFIAWFRAVAFLQDPANAVAVANIASIYAFAGTEAITPADVATYAKITPIHDTAGAWRENDLAAGNIHRLIQRFSLLRRLQGQPLAEHEIAKYFQLDAIREVSAQTTTTALAVSNDALR